MFTSSVNDVDIFDEVQNLPTVITLKKPDTTLKLDPSKYYISYFSSKNFLRKFNKKFLKNQR
jgi:hypothetical protein